MPDDDEPKLVTQDLGAIPLPSAVLAELEANPRRARKRGIVGFDTPYPESRKLRSLGPPPPPRGAPLGDPDKE